MACRRPLPIGAIRGPNGDSYDLYPTQTETAANYASLKRTSTAAYDFYTGIITEMRDIDNDVKTVTEYDTLGRALNVRTAANTPLESWVRTEYNDAERRVIVRADLETMGDGKKIAIQHYDELGRVRLTRTLENAVTEDPNQRAARHQSANPLQVRRRPAS